jgi:hypothetical protein
MRLVPALLLASYFVFACAFAVLVPPLEAPDEPEHIAYINYVATRGRLPNQDDPDQRAAGQGHQPPLYYLLTGLVFRALPCDAVVTVAPTVNHRYPPRLLREHSVPLFNHRAGSFFPTPGDRVRFYGLRLVNVLVGAANLLLMLRVAGLFFPDSPWRFVPPLFVATLPQYLFLSAVITNDDLANLFATAVVYASFRILAAPDRVRPYVMSGLCLGLGILTKKTLLVLVPPVGLLLLVTLLRAPRAAGRTLIVPAGALLVSGWYFVRNRLLYGEWLASQMELRTLPTIVDIKSLDNPYFRKVFPEWFLTSLVGRFGWMNLRLPGLCYVAYAFLAVACLPGLCGRLVAARFRDGQILMAFAYVASTLAGIVYYNLSFSQPQGRYLFPVLSVLTVLATIGLRAVVETVPSLALRRGLLGAMVAALFVMVFVSLSTVYHFYWSDWDQYAGRRQSPAHGARPGITLCNPTGLCHNPACPDSPHRTRESHT